jgi:hypothetical protein
MVDARDPDQPIVAQVPRGPYRFVVAQQKRGLRRRRQWQWVAIDMSNGEPVGYSGEGLTSRAHALDMAHKMARVGDVVWLG